MATMKMMSRGKVEASSSKPIKVKEAMAPREMSLATVIFLIIWGRVRSAMRPTADELEKMRPMRRGLLKAS